MKKLLIAVFALGFGQVAFAQDGVIARCSEVINQSGPSCGDLSGLSGGQRPGTIGSIDLEVSIFPGSPRWAVVNGRVSHADGSDSQLNVSAYEGSAFKARTLGQEAFSETDQQIEIVESISAPYLGFTIAQTEAVFDKKSNQLTFKYRVGSPLLPVFVMPVVCKATFRCTKMQ